MRFPVFFLSLMGFLGCMILGQSCLKAPLSERPRDPWAIRSVLDNRPRMLTLAMHQEVYLAYDLSKGTLYKAWKGDIALNGAPFNNLKTIQPTSVGASYLEDSLDHAMWTLKSSSGIHIPAYVYRGYRLTPNRILLQYALVPPTGDTIWVGEEPRIRVKGSQNPSYERHFMVKGLPKGDSLSLVDAGGEVFLTQEKQVWKKSLTLDSSTYQEAPRLHKAITSGARFYLEKSGCNTCHEEELKTIGPAYREIAHYYQDQADAKPLLVKKVREGGSGTWGEVAMPPHPLPSEADLSAMLSYILSLKSATEAGRSKRPKAPLIATKKEQKPGWGSPLEGVHPSFDLISIRPAHFKPKVGAMDFLPNGDLLLTTWDSVGGLYQLSGLESDDSTQIKIKRIASGLAEPLGLKVIDGNIYVLQKQELTRLYDHDGDEFIDEYRAICASFEVSADFHEFSYGLEYHEGYFYANLGLAMRQMEHERQLPDRGRTIRIHPSGNYEGVNHGLRQANGIGKNSLGELFVTENQGRWVPACKLIHVQEGAFEGCRLAWKDSLPEWEMRPPAVWLPHNEIGNSPGEPIEMLHGPYRDHLIHGDVTHGGLKRVFLEKIDGEYQGCVFRFSQGLEAGIHRLAWSPDSSLYVGGVGMNGNWGWRGVQYGLQKLKYNGKIPFELLEVSARPDGLMLTFTESLDSLALKHLQEELFIDQWYYEPTPQYGGPKLGLEELSVGTLSIDSTNKQVHVPLTAMKTNRVIHLVLPRDLKSEAGKALWSGEAWYTMNRIPERK